MLIVLLFGVFFGFSETALEQLAQFTHWDILTKIDGEVLLTTPGSQKCFGLGLNFGTDLDSSTHITFRGVRGPNITESVSREVKTFCAKLGHKDSIEYELMPVMLKDFETINVGDEQPTAKTKEAELDYEYELSREKTERMIDLRTVFDELHNGRVDQLVTTQILQETLTEFLGNHVDDWALKNGPVELALARVATIKPAKCDKQLNVIHLQVCVPALDFFNTGNIVEIVHKGQFVTFNNETFYAQISLPSHVFVPSGDGRIVPIDVNQCKRPTRHDFFCSPNALLSNNACQPPLLKNCSIILSDSRMPAKVREFSNGYLVRSFKNNVEQICGNHTTKMIFPMPLNMWWRPVDECLYTIGEHIEMPSLDGVGFETFLENQLRIEILPKALDGYFYERLPGPKDPLSHYESVWRHQRKLLYVQSVNGNTLIVGPAQDKAQKSKSSTEAYRPQQEPVYGQTVTPKEKVGLFSEPMFLLMLFLSLLLNVIILVVFVVFVLARPRHQKLAQHM
ncbi:unnamed protein product, partial [Mesorhabditis belari]|uniref:Uncharacterized protein n=1 Tax=Mesorhabditis belari TaxID=2138241 RepID=A0AAF3EEB6_9BILA